METYTQGPQDNPLEMQEDYTRSVGQFAGKEPARPLVG